MKISTKKLVSSIVAFCMLFTTVFSNTVLVSADTASDEAIEETADEAASSSAVSYDSADDSVISLLSSTDLTPAVPTEIGATASATVPYYAPANNENAYVTTSDSTYNVHDADSNDTTYLYVPFTAQTSGTVEISATVSVAATGGNWSIMQVWGTSTDSEGVSTSNNVASLRNDSSKAYSLMVDSDSNNLISTGISCAANTAVDVTFKIDLDEGDVDMTIGNTTVSGTITSSQIDKVIFQTAKSATDRDITVTNLSIKTVEDEEDDGDGNSGSGSGSTKTANLTASGYKTKYKEDAEFDVVYTLTDSDDSLSNFTGFVEYNEEVVMLEKMVANGSEYAVATDVTNSVDGYEGLADGVTMAMNRYGKVKIAYVDENDSYDTTIDDGTELLVLSFKAIGIGNANIKYVPYDFVDSSNEAIDVTITNPTSIKVIDDSSVIITATASTETAAVNEEFTVDFAIDSAVEFSSLAGTLSFDDTLVELTDLSAAETYADYFTGDVENKTAAINIKDSNGPVESTTTADEVLFTATFKAIAEGTATIDCDYTMTDASNNEITIVADAATVTIEGEAEPSGVTLNVVPSGATASESGVYTYTFTKSSANTIDVDYTVTDNEAGIANADLFIEFDPDVLVPTEITDGIIETGGLNVIVPSAENEDYAAYGSDGEKTNIELGAVKVAGYTTDYKTITGDATLFTVTYEVAALADSTTLKATVPTNENGTASWGAPEDVDKAEWARTITVNNADVALTGELGGMILSVDFYGTLPEGVTDNGDGTYTVSKDVTSFQAAVNVTNNTGINAFTAYLDYDADLVTVTSVVEYSNLLPEETFIDDEDTEDFVEGVFYVPSTDNSDYAELGADGVKTTAELGRLVLTNGLADEEEYTDNGAIAVFEFTRVTDADGTPYGGDLTIGLTDVQVTDADIAEVSFTAKDLTCTLEGTEVEEEEEATTKLHLLGKVSHSGETIGVTDTILILNYARNQNGLSETDKDLADIDGNGSLTAGDVVHALSKARNQQYMFSEIDGGRGTDSSVEGYITVVGYEEYINVPSDYECDCDTTEAA